ncbi:MULTISPECIES: hypothetical protein [unclassified Shewanella]|uniref:hypothetical protein n=1 Tax=unclassified Shewanella TaxID=196818 RepID=UPI003552E935
MEMYAQLIVKTETSVWQQIKEIVEDTAELETSSLKSGFGQLYIMGSSDLSDDIDEMLQAISKVTQNPVLVWLDGDEEPEPELISLVAGNINRNTLSSSYFEYLEEADEDELDSHDRSALRLGASGYFEKQYQDWIAPYTGQFNDADFKEKLEDIVDMC